MNKPSMNNPIDKINYNWALSPLDIYSNNIKFGIILSTYGSASHQGSSSIKAFQTKMEDYFNVPVRIAYTSEQMRKRLAHAKTKSDSVLKALQKMHFEKFTHLAVQSLHLIPGLEYLDVLNDIQEIKKTTTLNIKTGLPLISNDFDVLELVKTLLEIIPKEFGLDDKLIYMGHGTPHYSDIYYQKLAKTINKLDQRVYIGCISGTSGIDAVLHEFNKVEQINKVWLLPLLTTIGRHALHDMAGDDPDSWKNIIRNAGYNCFPYLSGLAESNLIQNIWIKRLCTAIEEF